MERIVTAIEIPHVYGTHFSLYDWLSESVT